jgi:hypothetical protein
VEILKNCLEFISKTAASFEKGILNLFWNKPIIALKTDAIK